MQLLNTSLFLLLVLSIQFALGETTPDSQAIEKDDDAEEDTTTLEDSFKNDPAAAKQDTSAQKKSDKLPPYYDPNLPETLKPLRDIPESITSRLNDKIVAQIKGEGNQLNLYDGDNNLLHTFNLKGHFHDALSTENFDQNTHIFVTRADDVCLVNAKTDEVIDSYNLKMPSYLKDSNFNGFTSTGRSTIIEYDSKGKFIRNTFIPIEKRDK